jgi:hypothetical protein
MLGQNVAKAEYPDVHGLSMPGHPLLKARGELLTKVWDLARRAQFQFGAPTRRASTES